MDLKLFFLCVSGCPVRKIVGEPAERWIDVLNIIFSSFGQVHSNLPQTSESLLVYCLTSPFLTFF